MTTANAPARPYITPKQARVAAVVLALAALNCAGGHLFILSWPPETGSVDYWLYQFYWNQEPLWFLAPPALLVALSAFIAFRQLRLRTRGLEHTLPVIGLLVSALLVYSCGWYILWFLGGYRHITSAQYGEARYDVGRTIDIDGLGDYWLCSCNEHDQSCQCAPIHSAGWEEPAIQIVAAEAGAVTVLLGDKVIFTGTPAGP